MTIRGRSKAFATIAILIGAISGYGHANGQDCSVELAGARRVESKRYVLAYRTEPEKIKIGQHFAIDFILCTKDGGAGPASIRVDASMPEHRHGMNYRASVTRRGLHQHRAEGLLFHMPGRWEIVFDVHSGGPVERLTHSVIVR